MEKRKPLENAFSLPETAIIIPGPGKTRIEGKNAVKKYKTRASEAERKKSLPVCNYEQEEKRRKRKRRPRPIMGETLKRRDFRPSEIPVSPGVYLYRDRFGTVIYVGKARNLRRRMSQYFQPSRETRADPKLRSLIHSIESWEYIPVRSEDESLILESRLIKEYAPKYNILLRDDKRLLLLKVDPNEKFPRLKLARLKKDDSCLYFGPFPKGGELRRTAEFLTRHLGLRSCKAAVPGEADKAHCLAGTVRDCCRPCVGDVSEEEYSARVQRLIEILNGDISEITDLLKQKMTEAAGKKQYEKAAAFRDMAHNLESLYGEKRRIFLRGASGLVVQAPGKEGVKDLQEALKLGSPPQNIECFDISNISGTLAVASLVHFTDGRPDKARYKRFRIRTVVGANDFAMMAEAVKRHFTRLMEEHIPFPDLLMVDGGKGQLSSTLKALVEINSPPFPVIGLAKKQEEIFVPGRSEALVLPHDRSALKLLQAVRDEAHRFAITYHRSLRLKLIKDSILDDIEGIGKARKNAILQEFGSVRALRRATPEEIARRIPGIGPEFAHSIYEYLQTHKPDGEIDPL